MGRVINAFAQFFDGSGAPLVNGWLLFLESSSNNTKKNTYNDSLMQILNANPLQLDAEGRCPSVFGTGDYRVISYTNDVVDDIDVPGTMLQTFDPVTAQGTLTGGGGGAGLAAWSATETYDLGDIVIYNTQVYRSLINGNFGLNPAIETGSWEAIDFMPQWNDTIYYNEGEYVYYGRNFYLSLQSLNINQQPDEAPGYWRPVATGFAPVVTKIIDYEVLPTENDILFVFGSAAVAGRQIDLPAMDATLSGFRVAFYNNNATYNLTIATLTGETIWRDLTLVIPPYVYAELRYDFTMDTWIVHSLHGGMLGGQVIGSPSRYITAAYIGLLHDGVTVPDDESMYFGDDNDTELIYNSAGSAFQLKLAAGNDFELYIDSVLHWEFVSTGELLVGAANPLPYIGNVASPIPRGYFTYIYIPDNGHIYLGAGNDIDIYHDGANNNLFFSNGLSKIGTLTAHDLDFYVNNTQVLYFDAATLDAYYSQNMHLPDSKGLYLGTGSDTVLYYDGTNFILDNLSGIIYFKQASVNAFYIDASLDGHFTHDLYIANTLYVTNDIVVTDDITCDRLNFTSIYDGSNLLTATFAEINARCDNVPIRSTATSAAFESTTSSKQVLTLNLGTVTDGDFGIVFFSNDNMTKWLSAGQAGIELAKYSGTSTIRLGGYASTPVAVFELFNYYYSSLNSQTDNRRMSGCTTLEITGTGTLVLDLTLFCRTTSVEANGFCIEVLWLKKQ